jgi:hypothetical protein
MVAPLTAARRIQDDLNLTSEKRHVVEQTSKKIYEPTVYGDFLLRKVGSNFATGGGRYD